MKDIDFKRFDFDKEPKNAKWYLKPLFPILCEPGFKKHKTEVTYLNGADCIKGPYLLLCNHNAFQDFRVAMHCIGYNQNVNFVVAIDGFWKRENLLRNVGCICKRKFTDDLYLPIQLKKVIKRGNIVAIYPEARYSLCGTQAVLPKSIGKLAKFLKVPVVTLICHGHHINSPFWDTSHDRGVKGTQATFKVLLTQEEVSNLPFEEINKKIVKEFKYDDFKWQLDNKIKVEDPNRAKGLHKVLYKCPECGTEYEMDSFGTTLKCNHCGKTYQMNEYGQLKAEKGKTEFSHIPDWYEWERKCVKKEIEEGTYSSGKLSVQVDSLPNADDYVDIGKGYLIHDMNGFHVETVDKDGDSHIMDKPVNSTYSVHIEYQYLFKKGDCVDLNTLDDTWYVYPEGNQFSVTKISLATEELYKKHLKDLGIDYSDDLV